MGDRRLPDFIYARQRMARGVILETLRHYFDHLGSIKEKDARQGDVLPTSLGFKELPRTKEGEACYEIPGTMHDLVFSEDRNEVRFGKVNLKIRHCQDNENASESYSRSRAEVAKLTYLGSLNE